MALSDLERTLREHRAALIRGDRGAALVMAGHYRVALRGIDREIERLTTRMEQAEARGERLRPNWAYREQRLEALKQQATEQITRFTDAADGVIRQEQTRAAIQAQEDVRSVVTAQANPQTPQAARALETAWNSLPAGAVEDLAGVLSNGSPLHTLLREIPGQVAGRMEETLIEGLALGRGPRVIAAQLRDAGGIAYSRALNISRTETIRAYRNSTSRAMEENEDVLNGWKWHATLDRCCVACYAMHGTYHPVGTTLDGHPSCRCAQVPITKSWAEIGDAIGVDLRDIPDSSVDFPMGEELFAKEPLARKIELLGVQGVDAWMKGEVVPADFVALRTNKAWGAMRTARTPRQAIEAGAQRRERAAADLAAREARLKARAGVKAKRPIKRGQGETWALDADQTLAYLRTLDEEVKAAIAAANDKRYAIQETALKAGEKYNALATRQAAGEVLSAEEAAFLSTRRQVMDNYHAEVEKAEKQWRKLSHSRQKRLREALHAPPAERINIKRVVVNAKGDRLKEIEQAVDEFEKLVTNKQLDGKPVWIHNKSTKRAFYRSGEVHLDNSSGGAIVAHELGHWLEDMDPALLRKLVDLRNARIKPGETLQPYQPNSPTELAWHDDWSEPYTGKVYQSGGKDYATEVASMGIEQMWRDPIRFAQTDPEFFRFTLDTVMRGR